MRIVAISDTHTRQKDLGILPDGDVLIHAGDWTFRGGRGEIRDFLEWFNSQPHKHKVFIAGNHELTLDPKHEKYDAILRNMVLNSGAAYLENSSIKIEGINFYGSPASSSHGGWGFGVDRGEPARRHWAKVPDDTHVLITHGPPRGILDTAEGHTLPGGSPFLGCEHLTHCVRDLLHLRAHVFGHIHDSSGVLLKPGHNGFRNPGYVQFVNAACCNEAYRIANPPKVFDIY